MTNIKTIWKKSKQENGQTWKKIKANGVSLFYDCIDEKDSTYFLYENGSLIAILYKDRNEIKG